MILSIETSTPTCSMALHSIDGELQASSKLRVKQSHAEALTLLIDEAMKRVGVNYTDLKVVAVSAGPGSYTGLRIGVSVAKGICFGSEIKLIAIDTLKAMADQVSGFINDEDVFLCPMLDARRMEVYSAIYTSSCVEVSPAKPMILDELSYNEYLSRNPVYFFGNGSNKWSEISTSLNARFIDGIEPLAESVGALAIKKWADGVHENIAYFEPEYLKPFHTIPSKKKSLI